MRQAGGNDMERETAEGERWLRRFETPGPSAEAIERIKRALTVEMGQSRMGGRATPMQRYAAWQGTLAAAAAIVLAVGIGWYSWGTHDRVTATVADLGESFPLPATAREMLRDFGEWDRELSALESEEFDDAMSEARQAAWEIGGTTSSRTGA